jgi:choline dehydrogenase-like flavoprotein
VGRNLMLHLNEVFAYFPGGAAQGPSRGVAFRDLYLTDGQRMGIVQTMGVQVGLPEILHVLRQRWARSALGRTRTAQEFARLPALIAARLLGQAGLFVGLLEDLPYAENRVESRDGQIAVTYRLAPELLARRRRFRALIRRNLSPTRTLFLNSAPEPNWGHPCGTLRMGTDPATSVTGPDGRVHGVDNLWVADAGLFPTSTGVNPSLTIAALALHVAGGILEGARP